MKKWQFTWSILLILLMAACSSANTTIEPTLEVETAVTNTPALSEPVFQTKQPGDVTEADKEASATESDAAGESSTDKAEVEMGDAVLFYERAGGLKGIGSGLFSWNFFADGRIVGSDGREWQVPPAEIESLINDVLALGFTGFDASYIPEDSCCDRVTHTLAVQQNGQATKVSVLDAADAPDELFQAVNMVNDYLMALPTE
jgi:hypothetical protein